MKLTAFFSGTFRLLIGSILVCGFALCGRERDASDKTPEISAISDAIRDGDMDEAVRLTDELKRKSLAKGDSALWSEAMTQQGVNAYYQRNPGLVLASADSAITWLERQRPSKERARILAKAYQTYGAYYDQYQYNPDSTAKYLRKSLDNAEMSGIRTDLPQVYGNYANALRLGASLDSAAVYYHRAISIADSIGMEKIHYTPLYNGIAGVFSDMHDFDNSEFWWKKSMEIFDTMDQFDRFNTLTGFGNHYYYKGDYPEAEKMFTRLSEMLDSIPESRWERMFTDVNLADTYIRQGRTENANAMLDSTSRYFTTEQPNPVATSYIHTLQIRAAITDGRLEQALQFAKRNPESDTLRLEQHLARLKALEELYSLTGNYRQAYATRSRYDHLNDSLRSDKISQRMSALNAIYQRDHRILNLEAGNTRQQAHIYRLVAIIAFSLVVIVGLILFFVVRRANMRKREDRMMKKIIKLREENLRNRVTPHFIYNALNHELHNTAKGNPSHLDSLVHLIRRQQFVASEMLIPFSEELKFVDDYIKVLGDNGRDPLNYTFSISPGIDQGFLFPSMALQILVENAFKHGFPTLEPGAERRLDITVTHSEGDRISVTVFNNSGSMANTYAKAGGTGLRVLMETIRLIKERNRENITFKTNPDAERDGFHGHSATITLSPYIKP